MWIDLLIGVVTVLTLIGVVAVRSLSSGSVEVKLNDAIIAAIAAVLLLFITGRINKVSLTSGGVSFEAATKAILSASAEPIKDQVATLPVVPIDESLKLGVSEIPMLIGRQVQALDFLMGAGVYQGDAVRQYLESLTKYEFFRFVILLNPDRTMFGIIDARKLLATLQDQRSNMNFASFATQINGNNRDALKSLPGIVMSDAAINRQTPKREALQRMEMRAVDWLPVLASNGRFDGIIDRSRLTTSLILDVTNRLEASTSPQ